MTDSLTLAQFLSGILLVGIRIGGLFVFAPFFSSSAIPTRVKAVFALALTLAVGPVLAAGTVPSAQLTSAKLASAHLGPELTMMSVLGECAVSLLFGLTLSLLTELANTAGQLVGMQTSFNLVNLIDPSTRVEITLFSQLFQLLVTMLLVTAGLDRILLVSLLRTFSVLPPGAFLTRAGGLGDVLPLAGGIFLAAFQLVTPLLAATTIVELAIALMSKLSPQLPVIALTIPAKTIVSLLVLISCLSFWTHFFEASFARLLDAAQLAMAHSFVAGG